MQQNYGNLADQLLTEESYESYLKQLDNKLLFYIPFILRSNLIITDIT